VTKLEIEQAAIIKSQALLIEKLQLELLMLKRRLFGRSSEAADLLTVQGQLFDAPAVVAVESKAPSLPRTPKTDVADKQTPKREVIPDGLRREIVLLDLPDDVKAGLKKIGEDTSERLAIKPSEIYVVRTVRPRYANPQDPDTGIQQMLMPKHVIDAGILHESAIAHIAISKFADHIPLSRQIEGFGRSGITFALSTLSDNLLTVAELWLFSLIDALWQVMRQRTSLHVDETVLPTLPERNSTERETRKTRLWTYLSDAGPPITLFEYTETKAGQHVQEMLKHWKDPSDALRPCYLHADAASNYEALYRIHPHIKPVNCWAHARRKFYAIAQENSTRIFAHEMVEQIDVLFAFERDWKSLSDDDRLRKRQTAAKAQLDKIHTMLTNKLIHQSPNSATGQAISYLTKRWDNFTRYIERGDLNISNNAAERALRKAALGRKNFLFVGNDRGGKAAAIYYSLIETAKANDIEPRQWLEHALRELPKRKGSSFNDVKDLLPIKGAQRP
jgi:transposase